MECLRLVEPTARKETKGVEAVGKAICFLGYLMFRVFFAYANPHLSLTRSERFPAKNAATFFAFCPHHASA